MKNSYLSLLALGLLSACTPTTRDTDVVYKTYVHRYGVSLEEQDWTSRGRDGQITYVMKDGVTVTCCYNQGVLEGESSYTYPHTDFIQKRENYCQGALVDEIWNAPNGVPQKQVTHRGPYAKTVITWYDGGAPQSKEEWENNRLITGEYFTTSNQIESKVEDGNGTRTRRNSVGQLISLDEIKDGQMVLSSTYHLNGTPESITPYAGNCAEGLKRTFLSDGQPNTVEEWSNDQQHGNTIQFLNGEVYSEVPYVKGKQNGIEKCYRNGEVAQETTWVDGQRHGPCNSYVAGNTKTTWYCRGQLVNKATFEAYKDK